LKSSLEPVKLHRRTTNTENTGAKDLQAGKHGVFLAALEKIPSLEEGI
jgi:hypothetical protein